MKQCGVESHNGVVTKATVLAYKICNALKSLARFVSGRGKHESAAGIICTEFEWLFPKELGEFKTLRNLIS